MATLYDDNVLYDADIPYDGTGQGTPLGGPPQGRRVARPLAGRVVQEAKAPS